MTQLFCIDTLASGFPSSLTGGTLGGSTYVCRSLTTSRGGGVVNVSQASSASSPLDVFDSGSTSLYFAIRITATSFSSSNSLTSNAWGLESNAMANFQPGSSLYIYTNAGSFVATLLAGSTPGSEWGTSAAVRNWSTAQGAVSASSGDWLIYVPSQAAAGTPASGFTLTWSYNGTTGAANGDTYITTVETITEFTESRVPFTNRYPQLLAH